VYSSKTDNTQLIWDFKASWKYKRIWLTGKYPKKVPYRWSVREKQRYWNSEKAKAKRVMERGETPEPTRPRHVSDYDSW